MNRTCPFCGHENPDALGVFDLLAGPDDDPLKTDRVKCENCDRTYLK
jgi:hypothetical protein